MSASATDQPPAQPASGWAPDRPLPRRRGILRAARWLLLAGLLTACAEEPLPVRRLSHDDCLTEVKLDRLKEALERCDKVVAAFPQDPLPLNERFLLHTLAEDDKAACRDIIQAHGLADRVPAARLDPLLRRDLDRRLADCRGVGATTRSKSSPRPPAVPAAGSPAIQKLPHQNR